jgi:hypothetical protein
MNTAEAWNGNTMGGATARRDADAYYTPDPLALAICLRLADKIGDARRIVEPSAGSGAFVRAARVQWPHAYLVAVEPNAPASPLLECGANAVAARQWEDAASIVEDDTDLILGNPPFLLWQAHAELALQRLVTGGHLCFLLRASALAGVKRVAWLRESGLRWVWHIAPRPSFTGGGTDGAEYAVLAWEKGYAGAYEGGWIQWR